MARQARRANGFSRVVPMIIYFASNRDLCSTYRANYPTAFQSIDGWDGNTMDCRMNGKQTNPLELDLWQPSKRCAAQFRVAACHPSCFQHLFSRTPFGRLIRSIANTCCRFAFLLSAKAARRSGSVLGHFVGVFYSAWHGGQSSFCKPCKMA